jgi:hypothetical protein
LAEGETLREKEKELEKELKKSLALAAAEEGDQLQCLSNSHQDAVTTLNTNHEVELSKFRDIVSEYQSALKSVGIEIGEVREERDQVQIAFEEMECTLKDSQVKFWLRTGQIV